MEQWQETVEQQRQTIALNVQTMALKEAAYKAELDKLGRVLERTEKLVGQQRQTMISKVWSERYRMMLIFTMIFILVILPIIAFLIDCLIWLVYFSSFLTDPNSCINLSLTEHQTRSDFRTRSRAFPIISASMAWVVFFRRHRWHGWRSFDSANGNDVLSITQMA